MMRALCVSLLVLFCLPLSAWSEQISSESSVVRATLYPDRAEVTRLASISLPAGNNSVILRKIPQTIDPSSLQAQASGSHQVVIQGVEYKSIALKEDVSAEVQALTLKLEEIERTLTSLGRKKEGLERQRQMLTGLSLDTLVPEGSGKTVRPRTPKEMAEVLALVNETDKRLEPEIQSVSLAMENAQKEKAFINSKLASLQRPQKSESVIEVSLASSEPAQLRLEVSYQVRGAGWQPTYNLQVKEKRDSAPEFGLETFGLLQQKSGEEWENVEITLSTARPALGLNRPDPFPTYLDVFEPMAPKKAGMFSRMASAPAEEQVQDELSQGLGAVASKEEESNLREQAAVPQSAEMLQGAVVAYRIPSKVTLKSDGSVQKVFVRANELKGWVQHVAVPKLNSEVFREANLTNSEKEPLLPGGLTVFVDGRYIGQRSIGFTQPGEEMRVPVGVSQDVTIKVLPPKVFKDDPGIVRSISRVRKEHKLEVLNHSAREQKLVVLEGVPVSRSDKITVKINDIEPDVVKAGDPLRLKDIDGILEWHLQLAAKGKTDLKYSTTVEHPANLPISGGL